MYTQQQSYQAMKRYVWYPVVSILLLLCIYSESLAQTQSIVSPDSLQPISWGDTLVGWKAGIQAGVNLNFHSVEFRGLPGVPSCCPSYSSGFGSGYFVYGFYAKPLTQTAFFSVGAMLSSLQGTLRTTENQIVDDNGIGQATIEHSIKSSITTVAIIPSVRYEIMKQLTLHGGVQAGLILPVQYSQTEKILAPSDVVFTNDRRDRLTYSGTVEQTNSVMVGLRVGASTTLPLTKNNTFSLEPEISYTHMLTNVLSTSAPWKVHTLQIGASLVYTGYSYPPAPPPLPIPVQAAPPPPPKPKLEISKKFRVTLLDKNDSIVTNPLKVKNIVSQNSYATINYIFFDSASAVIPARYTRISQDSSAMFNPLDMNATSTMQIYYNLLNIVGKRLQNLPSSTITIVGCNSGVGTEKNNLALSRQRAESVRDYLQNVWGIKSERLKIQARNLPENASNTSTQDGIDENRRVELRTENLDVLEPLMFYDTTRVMNLARYQVSGTVKAEAGVYKWTVQLRHKGTLIKSIEEIDPNPEKVIEWSLTNQEVESLIQLDGTIDGTLTVEDNDGNMQTVNLDPIDIEQVIQRNSTLQRFSLITFAFNNSTISLADQRIVNIIRKNIAPKSIVTVVGYTDRVGDELRNQALSEERAVQVAKALKIPPQQATGFGKRTLLYDNDLPEGRFLSRTVIIAIETPTE